MDNDLSSELMDYLVYTLGNVPRTKRDHWVMNSEWWDECRHMTCPFGHPVLYAPMLVTDPERLYGLEVEVTEDGGVPHIVSG
jgi:hypothetical protein